MPLLPYVRREIFLQAIKNRDASALPDPNNREELFLKAIADEVAQIPSGVSVVLPAAVSEMLANLPEAHTHTELFYKDIIDAILIATTITDTTPYISRETAGGLPVSGTAELKKKLGNTVCVNQLVPYGDFSSSSGWSSWYYGGTVSVANDTGTVTGNGNIDISHALGVTIPAGHTVLFLATVKGSASGNGSFINVSGQFPITTSFAFVAKIGVLTGAITRAYIARQGSGSFTMDVKNVAVIDLTLWFGSNDRIPSHLLSHPEDWGKYYAGSLDYNAGTLDSADGTMLTSRGADDTTVLAEVDTGSEVLRSAGAVADEKNPDGTITRRGIDIDLGTLNYYGATADGRTYSYGLTGIQTPSAFNVEANVRSAKYIALTQQIWYAATTPGVTITGNGYGTPGQIGIVDSALANMDSAQIQAALSGIHVYAELATPTTEQGSPFNSTYGVEYRGTESWTNLKGIPQGHETEYTEYTT